MKSQEEQSPFGCASPPFERNNFYHGKMLTARDLQDEQAYLNQKRWLLNRLVSGCGVVCGLDVVKDDQDDSLLIVAPGVAFDCCGREIIVPDSKKLKIEEGMNKDWVVCLEYKTCKTEKIWLDPEFCDLEKREEFNRIRESFELSLKPALKVKTHKRRHDFRAPKLPDMQESVHNYASECPKCEDAGCVILARVTANNIDYADRGTVYNNDLLFELIGGRFEDIEPYDAKKRSGKYVSPRITAVNWLQEPIPHTPELAWSDFKKAVEDGFRVYFSRRMKADSINQHSFLFAVTVSDGDTGWQNQRFVRAKEIIYEESGGDCSAVFRPDENWIAKEINGADSSLAAGIVRAEIVLRGDLIVSARGKALDGNFLNYRPPSGNGAPGGDFVSCFSVAAKV